MRLTKKVEKALEAFDLVPRAGTLLQKAFNSHWLILKADGERVVLREYDPARTRENVQYEVDLLARLRVDGWPVADHLADPVLIDRGIWALVRYLPGRAPAPRSLGGRITEQRKRGRLLARLHTTTRSYDLGQREGWARGEAVFTAEPSLDEVLGRLPRGRGDEAKLLKSYAALAEKRLRGLHPDVLPVQVIHGDFAPWNLRFQRGQLSGILDFDFAHLNHRVADFCLSWRGHHDGVIDGYNDESPLSDLERELIGPVWWAWLLEAARRQLIGEFDSDLSWILTHLVRESPYLRK